MLLASVVLSMSTILDRLSLQWLPLVPTRNGGLSANPSGLLASVPNLATGKSRLQKAQKAISSGAPTIGRKVPCPHGILAGCRTLVA